MKIKNYNERKKKEKIIKKEEKWNIKKNIKKIKNGMEKDMIIKETKYMN